MNQRENSGIQFEGEKETAEGGPTAAGARPETVFDAPADGARPTADPRAARRFVEQLVEIVPHLVYLFDLASSRPLYINRVVAAALGYEPAEIIGLGADFIPTLMHPDDRALFIRHHRRLVALADGAALEFEYRMRHKSGDWRWFLSRDAVYRRDEAGRPIEIIGTAADVTERRQAEKAARQTAAYLSLIADTAPVLIANCDRARRFKFVNHGYAERFGLKPEDCVDRPVADVLGAAAYETICPYIDRVLAGEAVSFEIEVPYDAFGTRWMHCSYAPEFDERGAVAGWVSALVDVTTRRAAEQKLKESEDRFQLAFSAVKAVIYDWNIVADEVTRSDALGSLLGFAPDEPDVATNRWWRSRLHPEDAARASELVRDAIESGAERFEDEYRLRHRDGHYVWVRDSGILLRDGAGRAVRSVGTVRRIDRRKLAEERLRASEEKLREQFDELENIYRNAPIGLALIDRELRFVRINDRLAEINGHPVEAHLGRTMREIIPDIAEQAEAIFRRVFETGEALIDVEIEGETAAQPGFRRTWCESWYPLKNKAGETIAVSAVVEEITERNNAERALRLAAERNEVAQEAARAMLYEFVPRTGAVVRNESAVEALLGYKPADLPGTSAAWSAVIHPDDRARVWSLIRRGIEDGTGFSLEYRARHQNGEYIWLHDRARVIRDERGEVERVVGMALDLSERKQVEAALRESEEKYRTLFESIDEGFVIVEMIFDDDDRPVDYRFVQANPAFARLTGLPEDALGRTARELVPDLEDFWFETYGRVALTGETVRFENKSEPMGRWFEVHASRIGGPGSRRVAIVFTNISERKRVEEKLRLTNYRFTLAEEAAKGFNYEWNLETGEVTRSESIYRVTGYRREEFEKTWQAWADVTHPDDLPVATEAEAVELVNRFGEDTFSREYRMRHKDGHDIWLLERGLLTRDEEGRVRRVIGQSIDVTERKVAEERLLEAERRAARDYQQLLARLAPLAQTLGTARDLTAVYRALLEFIRYETPCEGFFISFYNAEERSKQVKYVWCEGAEEDAANIATIPLFSVEGANSRAIRTGKSVVTERDLAQMEGQAFQVIGSQRSTPAQSLVTPMIVMGRVIGTLEVQNHGEKYRPEHVVAVEMAANLAAVAIENVRLMNVESEARAAAEEANRAKDEFLAVLSHELRTPLNSIKGWVSMLQQESLDASQKKQAIEVIARNVSAQNSLIEDILDVSRIISGKMRLENERLSFVAVLKQALDAMRPLAEKKGLRLETVQLDARADEMHGDPVRLQQIVANLLSNAVKFTPPGGAIEVGLERAGDLAVLKVADDGIGIGHDILPRVFDRFQQADATTRRRYSGLGLGLAIVKHLVELHGGAVYATSEGEGRGAVFTVELPLVAAHVLSNADGGAGSANGDAGEAMLLANTKLLIVDDDADSLELLRVVLENQGARATCVSSAGAALERLAEERFDALISDVGMSGMDGYDLIRHVREQFELDAARLPAIALSGYVSADDRARALAAGFQQHFGKPVDVAQLPRQIRSLVDSAAP